MFVFCECCWRDDDWFEETIFAAEPKTELNNDGSNTVELSNWGLAKAAAANCNVAESHWIPDGIPTWDERPRFDYRNTMKKIIFSFFSIIRLIKQGITVKHFERINIYLLIMSRSKSCCWTSRCWWNRRRWCSIRLWSIWRWRRFLLLISSMRS